MGTSIFMMVTGFVGSDPQVREVGEQRVASFNIAVSRKVGNKKKTQWVRVSCWNKLAEVAEQYVQKGSSVQIITEWFDQSAWIDQSGTAQAGIDVNAYRLVLLDRVENGDTETDGGEDVPF